MVINIYMTTTEITVFDFHYVAGLDFSPLDKTLILQAESTQCINISIKEDEVFENSETFQVIISSTDDAVAIMKPNVTITIQDFSSK